jgi:hypothetical protein
VGQPTDAGQIAIVDPKSRVIALRIYPELIHIIPITKRGQLHESFDVRFVLTWVSVITTPPGLGP